MSRQILPPVENLSSALSTSPESADLKDKFLFEIFAAFLVALVKRETADCHILAGIIG